MSKEQEKKNKSLQKILMNVRKAAIKGAGLPSQRGTFEPAVPEKMLKNKGGVRQK